jgi:hypothetical protein
MLKLLDVVFLITIELKVLFNCFVSSNMSLILRNVVCHDFSDST